MQLIDRHRSELLRVARALTHNRADAEDAVQETLLGAYRGMKRFGGRSSVKTWLIKILQRQAVKARSRSARQTCANPGRAGQRIDLNSIAARTSSKDAEFPLDAMHELESLKEPHREVLLLKEIQRLTLEEISLLLKVPRGTVESRLTRARAQLRERLCRRGG